MTRKLALLLLLWPTACASAPPDPATFFRGRTTYAWLPGRPWTADLRADNEIVRDRIVSSVDASMQARGYRPEAVERADFLIAAYAVGTRAFRARPSKEQDGYAIGTAPRTAGGRDGVPVYETGVFVLDVIDPVWRQLMWRGTLQGDIRMDVGPEERDARVRRAAEKVVGLLPKE